MPNPRRPLFVTLTGYCVCLAYEYGIVDKWPELSVEGLFEIKFEWRCDSDVNRLNHMG
jgi:hypothetical protein